MSDCEVTFDAEIGCVTMTWRTYAPNGFRASNERVLGALADRGADRLLGEIEGLDRIADEDLTWLAEDWIPRAARSGLKRVALVTPAFELGHAGALLVGEKVAPAVELAYFDDLAAARDWLANGGA